MEICDGDFFFGKKTAPAHMPLFTPRALRWKQVSKACRPLRGLAAKRRELVLEQTRAAV